MLRKLLQPVLTIAVVGLIVGCSDNSTDPGVTEGDTNLTDEFGGYTSVAEAPGFDNPTLLEEAAADAEYGDALLASPAITDLLNDEEAGYYHLRIVWGQLQYNPEFTELTDFSGSLTTSRGAEIIRRALRFEEGQDYILPRTDRTLIEWVSFTSVHNDGLAIDLLIPPVYPQYDSTITWEFDLQGDSTMIVEVDTLDVDIEPVEVSFETGPYSRVFSLEEIAALDTIVYLDDGNAIAFHGFRLDRRPCPRGFLAGTWGMNDAGENIISGFWLSRNGAIIGFVDGHYGTDETGANAFTGKVIDLAGGFLAFIKGTYGARPDRYAGQSGYHVDAGWFKGRIYDADEMAFGDLMGRYCKAPVMNGGFFQGRWKVRCSEPAQEGNHLDDDGF